MSRYLLRADSNENKALSFKLFQFSFQQLHHLSRRVVFAILCHFSDDKDIFCLVLYMHLRQALKLVGWMEEQQEARQDGFGAMACSCAQFQGQGRTKCQQWLSEVWDNLSCLNLCVHSHSVCQHLSLVVTSQTCPKNTIESRVHFVIPRSTLCADTLGSDLKEIQGTACLLFLSNGKPRS